MFNRNPSGTQEDRVLEVLRQALNGDIRGPFISNDGWVNKQYFVRVMGLTQAGRAIWNLEHEKGIEIEHSDFKDAFGFKSFRLKTVLEKSHQLIVPANMAII